MYIRTTKALDNDKFNEELITAPWRVMGIFNRLEEKCNYWQSLYLFNLSSTERATRKFDVR